MASKRSRIGTEVASSSRSQRNDVPAIANELGIIFKNREQMKRYNALLEREVTTTRYPDFPLLEILGLDVNVTMLLNNLGWLNFLSPERATFEGITREFLSSVNLEPGVVSFRLFNTDYKMNLNDFGRKLGFPNEGWVHDSKYPSEKPVGYNRTEFWSQITGRDHYEARSAKSSSIHNPVFRYITRIMARTICGRGEMGGIRTDELFLLWAMIHQVQVNTCKYIINNLISVSERKQGDIVSGGMVTFIAHKLGLGNKLAHIDMVVGTSTIDLEMCRQMFLVKPLNENQTLFRLMINKKDSILLPNPERTDTTDPANWLYPDEAEEIPPENPFQAEEEMNDEPMQAEPQFNVQHEPEFHVQGEQEFNMQVWCMNMQREQQRQGAEQARQARMLEQMMQHLGLTYPPPPEQP